MHLWNSKQITQSKFEIVFCRTASLARLQQFRIGSTSWQMSRNKSSIKWTLRIFIWRHLVVRSDNKNLVRELSSAQMKQKQNRSTNSTPNNRTSFMNKCIIFSEPLLEVNEARTSCCTSSSYVNFLFKNKDSLAIGCEWVGQRWKKWNTPFNWSCIEPRFLLQTKTGITEMDSEYAALIFNYYILRRIIAFGILYRVLVLNCMI